MEKYLAVKYDNPRILLRDFENLKNQKVPVIATDFDDRYLIRFFSIYTWSLKVNEPDIVGFEVTNRSGNLYEAVSPVYIPYLWKGIDAIYKNSMNSKYMACMKLSTFKIQLEGITYETSIFDLHNIFNQIGTYSDELYNAILLYPQSSAPMVRDMYDKGYFDFWTKGARSWWEDKFKIKFPRYKRPEGTYDDIL